MAMVTSPTFALIQQYEAESGSVTHVDLYRLRSAAEIDTLGWDELVDTASVLLVEWPDRAGGALPPDAIAIELRHDPEHPDRRLLRVSNRRS
jgi:tRNA threonylcarbamoyl adenosine modification protein YjeE